MMASGSNLLGNVIGVYLGRSRNEEIFKRRTAGGGAVTSFLIYLLDKGEVDGVVTAKRVKGLKGVAIVARNREELLQTAGNKWSVVPYASKLRAKIEDEGLRKVAIVSLPCQAQFFGQMREFPLLETDFGERIKLIISLFCSGTFAYEAFLNYLKVKHGVQAENIRDIRLKEGVLSVIHDGKELEIPLEEAYIYLQGGCLVCTDYTGTWADLSAGTIPSKRKWTLLITRNVKTDELLRQAAEEGYIELIDGHPYLGEVLKAAKNKLARAQENIIKFL